MQNEGTMKIPDAASRPRTNFIRGLAKGEGSLGGLFLEQFRIEFSGAIGTDAMAEIHR